MFSTTSQPSSSPRGRVNVRQHRRQTAAPNRGQGGRRGAKRVNFSAKRGNLNPDRRVFGPVWKNCVIPTANRKIHDSSITDNTTRGLRGFRYAIGDETLFDGPFQFLRSMHEYRVTKVTFDVSVIAAPKGLCATHPVEVSSIVIPIDNDGDDTSEFKSFEHAMEHPGARSTVTLSNKVAHHKFTWWPTEPSDQDWRLVKNDNIVILYVFFRYTDSILEQFSIDTIVRAKVHLNFRGVNFDSKRALQQFSTTRTVKRRRTDSEQDHSPDSEFDYDMVVEPAHTPDIAHASQYILY